jgi:spermidine synthase
MSAKARTKAPVSAAPAPVKSSMASVSAFLLLGVALAGIASLVYEVVWVEQLALSLGSTAYAGSTMLTAFLGGLALGGWIGGRRADGAKSPLLMLAGLEAVAALVGALSVPVLSWTGHAYVLVVTGMHAGPTPAMLLRAAFSLVVMLLPATLFGIAFPLASAAAARYGTLERAAGGVYAASSFGSAVGAALGGLWLEPTLGLTGAALVAAGVNLLGAFAAWNAAYAAGERMGKAPAGEPDPVGDAAA